MTISHQRKATSSVFLFNPLNAVYLEAPDSRPQTTPRYGIKYFLATFMFIAVPIIILLTLLLQISGFSVRWVLPSQLIAGMAICSYYAISRYRRWRDLTQDGQLVYGRVIQLEPMPFMGGISQVTPTRIYYFYRLQDGDTTVGFIDLAYANERFPDGRAYPPVGTPIAGLFVTDKKHNLL